MKSSLLIPISEAAKVMGVSLSTLRFGLQQNKFPFGTAIECKKTWRYIIVRKRLEKYLSGEDMINHIHHIISDSCDTPKEVNVPLDEDTNNYINEQVEAVYKMAVQKAASEKALREKSLTQGQKLAKKLEMSGLYYTTDNWVEILGYDINPQVVCKKGLIKAFKPDGRRWYFKIEDFDSMDPLILKPRQRKRFEKYLKSKGESIKIQSKRRRSEYFGRWPDGYYTDHSTVNHGCHECPLVNFRNWYYPIIDRQKWGD